MTEETSTATETATTITDAELERLALDAEAHDPFAHDIEAFRDPDAPADSGLLPEWYMPAPSNRIGMGRRLGLAGMALGMAVVNIGGFCTTYGLPEWVWKG